MLLCGRHGRRGSTARVRLFAVCDLARHPRRRHGLRLTTPHVRWFRLFRPARRVNWIEYYAVGPDDGVWDPLRPSDGDVSRPARSSYITICLVGMLVLVATTRQPTTTRGG